MNTFRLPFVLIPLTLCIAAIAPAQQKICLSVHGGPSTGRTKHNTWPSELSASIKVGGVIDGTSTGLIGGLTAAEASRWHKTEFDFKGYVTCRTTPNEFCILAGPGGAPLQSDDYTYETTDTGLHLDVRVEPLNGAGPGCPGPGGTISPRTKSHGIGIAVPADAQAPLPVVPQPVRLEYLFEVRQGAVNTPVTVVAQVSTSWSGQQIRAAIEQALQQQGLRWTAARWPSQGAPGNWQDGLLIDRSIAGGTVHHLEFRSDLLSHWLMPMQAVMGTIPDFGATEFGRPTRGNAGNDPYAAIDASPRIGGTFQLEYHTGLANAPGGEAVSLGRASQPMPVLNGWLLVDPASTVFTFLLSDATGVMRRTHHVPNLAALTGLPLAFQGGAHDPSFTLSLTTGIAAVVMP